MAHVAPFVYHTAPAGQRRPEGRPRTAAPQLHQSHDGHLRRSDVGRETKGTPQSAPSGHSQARPYRNPYRAGNRGFSKCLTLWRPRRDLNPCYRRERAYQAVLRSLPRFAPDWFSPVLMRVWPAPGYAKVVAVCSSFFHSASPGRHQGSGHSLLTSRSQLPAVPVQARPASTRH